MPDRSKLVGVDSVQAKTIDLVGISYDIRRQAVVMAEFMDFVEEQFEEVLARRPAAGLPGSSLPMFWCK